MSEVLDDEMSLGEAFANKWKRYMEVCNGTAANAAFWDVVVVTAADKQQETHFETSLQELKESHRIPSCCEYIVVSDPPSTSPIHIGCGGSTLEVIRVLFLRFGDNLWNKKILVIHSGGQSKRLPICSFSGKAFTAIPWVCGNGKQESCSTLIEVKLATLLNVCSGILPGIFVTCADVIEMTLDSSPQRDFGFIPGFTAFAHYVSSSIALTHGVFVLETDQKTINYNTTIDCKRFLHRATFNEMNTFGALISLDGKEKTNAFVDSSYFFDSTIAKKLLDWYQLRFPLKCEIDAYGDFMQPLGSCATKDYLFSKARNATTQSQELQEARSSLYEILHGTRLRAVPLIPSAFVHFGTQPEFLKFICGGLQRMGFPWTVCVNRSPISENVCVMESYIGNNIHFGTNCAIEYSDLDGNIDIGSNSILCDVHSSSTFNLKIPSDFFVVTVALDSNLIFQTKEKTKNNGICFVTLCASGEELKSDPKSWTVPRFPIALTPESSLEETLLLLQSNNSAQSNSQSTLKMSWSSAISAKSLSVQRQIRSTLLKKIIIHK